MKLIVGLGNPGDKFKDTRHNVGFMVVEEIQKQVFSNQLTVNSKENKFSFEKNFDSMICKLKTENCELLLIEPQTFMNNSGNAIKKLITNYQLPITNLYVIHDDLDIPLGQYKIQFGKGPKVHNGLNSVETQLKTKDFWRVRIGVQGEHYQQIKAQGKSMAEEYVLKPFGKDEMPVITQVINEAAKELLKISNF